MISKLFNHQKEAINLAMNKNGNFALFHACGIGKTRSALEVFALLRAETPALKLLVICPKSLINAAWMNDVAKFTNFTASPFRGLERGMIPDIVIINYESLISTKIKTQILAMILAGPFMCILDESARCKNHKSLTTKTVLSLAPFFKHRLILTGVPCPNNDLELWGQIRFIASDLVDKSFYAFRNKWFHLERGSQVMAPAQGAYVSRQAMRDMMMKGWKYNITPEKREQLMRLISPVCHWVQKVDAIDLPDQVDQVREVILSGPEQKAYDDMKKYLVAEIKGQEIAAQVSLEKIMKLRQFCAGFAYNEAGVAVPTGNSKLNELEETLEELGPQPVIIFVEFKFEIDVIKKMISDKFGPSQVATLYSETEDRDDSVVGFQSGKYSYLIAHPKSAAHGLTLTRGSTMIFYSLSYSYESHEQARNRIHRISQTNKCLYIYLIAKGTIDEVLMRVLRRKADLQDIIYAIIGNSDQKQRAALAQKKSA
jgi:SNF2 family DNA or RNA helicase